MSHLKTIPLSFSVLLFSGIIGLASVSAETVPQQGQQTTVPSSTQNATPPQPQAEAMTDRIQMADKNTPRSEDRIVCKVETILGTRLKGLRTCRSASEWRRISRGFQSKLKDATDRGGAIYSGN